MLLFSGLEVNVRELMTFFFRGQRLVGAAAPGFNSLIPTPSVPSLISTEPVELLCRTSNITSTDPFCFVKQKAGSG